MLNLGKVKGPLLVFGGPYSNLQALEAIKHEAQRLSLPPEQCICTGDIVAYCAQPYETVELIRDWGIHCLMGNCEESFASGSDDCGCGFEEGTQCDLLSAQWFRYANEQLSSQQRYWFASLPRQIRFSIQGLNALVVHGSVSSINQFIFESTHNSIFEKECALSDADIVIGGHCGIPFTKKVGKHIWHNAGAIGMPANDGTPRTWYSIINSDDNNQLSLNHHALSYDHLSAQEIMIKADMDNGYAAGLHSGLWPSLDVLPEKEKQQQGTPKTANQLSFKAIT